ncbi:LytR/AlgR family response regulator transcription factor [Konateibacter massiliensis]|uniref:LytR/AlgR family response regulator transcription factor n=1 Tax=Konateibacter massiliensis TaxID=2002841 RepID=UPI0015D50EB3|nr:LytTR family DNA-binding domain-containing protein [Konateibacter massiliensis]
MKIAIIDDQIDDSSYLEKCLKKYMDEQNLPYSVQVFSSALSFLDSFSANYQLLIFDIDMPELNGIDAAKRVRQIDSDVPLMFITNMPQYAVDGYSVDAIDYVLKPISYSDFRLKIQKAMRYVKQETNCRLGLNTIDGYVCIMSSEIYYIESQLHYLIFHTSKGTFKTRNTLNEIEKKLASFYFSRSSVSYLINLKYMDSIHGNEIEVHGTQLKISRTKRASFLSAFTKYMGGLSE